jgi:hypothetical protein
MLGPKVVLQLHTCIQPYKPPSSLSIYLLCNTQNLPVFTGRIDITFGPSSSMGAFRLRFGLLLSQHVFLSLTAQPVDNETPK